MQTPQKMNTRIFRDVPSSHWAASAIQYVNYEQIMQPFPDGKFHPGKPVKRIEYIISLVKAKGLDLNKKGNPLPYRDVNPRHWTYKFIKSAYQAEYLPKAQRLLMNKPLSKYTLYILAKKLKLTSLAIAKAKDFKVGFAIHPKLDKTIMTNVTAYVEKQKQLEMDKHGITLKTPKNQDVVLEEMVLFNGKIFPPHRPKRYLVLNGRIETENAGLFSLNLLLPLLEGAVFLF